MYVCRSVVEKNVFSSFAEQEIRESETCLAFLILIFYFFWNPGILYYLESHLVVAYSIQFSLI